jgi:hypothetical protein
MVTVWTLALVIGAGLAVAAWRTTSAWRRRRRYRATLLLGRQLFRRRREWLEAEFLSLASVTGRPRDLVWSNCEFANDVAFARDRGTGQLRALVGITLRLDGPGGELFPVSSTVKAARVGTAVFHFDGQRWSSDGRAIFNLNPREAISRLRHEIELVD